VLNVPRVATVALHSFVADWLGPGSVVVDLGVNEGSFSMYMIDALGCSVYGAEPVPDLSERLPSHPRLCVEPVAIAGSDAEIDLYVNPSRCASLGLVEQGAERIRVAAWTLDHFFDRFDIQLVDLLKVDTEGAEIPIFDSASDELLLRCQQITVEFHDFLDETLASDVTRVCRRLEGIGFDRINFSKFTRGDVLFINPARRLGSVKRTAVIARYKYLPGAMRRIRRIV
jgi:FkbM family methyltransferase